MRVPFALLPLLLLPALPAFSAPYFSKIDPMTTIVVPPEFVVVEGYGSRPKAEQPDLTFEGIAQWVNEGKANSIPALLSLLPREMRDINYVLMYRSRSLQFASPQAPRVISFSPSGRLVLTFNGGEGGKRGANTLEMIQFRDETKRFEFREIEFPLGEKPRISEANPKKCIACHQSESRVGVDMRPNWEPYNIWPGAYGSFDASLGVTEQQALTSLKERPYTESDSSLAKDASSERGNLQAFLKIAAKNPRYQALGGLNTKAVLTLTEVLTILNLQRVSRLMFEAPEILQKMDPVWSWLAFCDEKLGIKYEEAHPELGKLLPDRPIFYPRPGTDAPEIFPGEQSMLPSILPSLLFAAKFYENFGVDTSDWSMDFATGGRLGLTDRFGTTTNSDGIFARVLKRELEARGMHPSCGADSGADGLQAKADAHLTSRLSDPAFLAQMKLPSFRTNEKQTLNSVQNKCLRCHDGTDEHAPEISFGHAERLRAELARKAKSGRSLLQEIRYRTGDLVSMEEQMPPGKKLDPAETKALRAFLGEMAK